MALGLVGWVRNDPDGAVSLEAIGPRSDVDELMRWCAEGPPSAKVSEVIVEFHEPTNPTDIGTRFEVRH